jgi:hypothetical protein
MRKLCKNTKIIVMEQKNIKYCLKSSNISFFDKVYMIQKNVTPLGVTALFPP